MLDWNCLLQRLRLPAPPWPPLLLLCDSTVCTGTVYLQNKCLVPGWIEWGFHRFRLLFRLAALIRHYLDLNVRVCQPVGVHRNQVFRIFHCNDRKFPKQSVKIYSDVILNMLKNHLISDGAKTNTTSIEADFNVPVNLRMTTKYETLDISVTVKWQADRLLS